jgi:large conductance mechanosensitive channel
MGMISEFKAFAMKGSLLDMAVGVVMATAFGAVKKAFIEGMFMPLVGCIFHVGNLNDLKWVISEAVKEGEKVITPESAIGYGAFIGALINFLIVAFVMFMIIKSISAMKKAEEAKPTPAPGPTADQALLMEIRDALKK